VMSKPRFPIALGEYAPTVPERKRIPRTVCQPRQDGQGEDGH